MDPRSISIDEFDYDLPPHRIALYQLAERDASKLLIYRDDEIRESIFHNISDEIPKGSLLVFNNTKVIRARLNFYNSAGGKVEIFCLEPAAAVTDYAAELARSGSTSWLCFVGGIAKWREDLLQKMITVNGRTVLLSAEKQGKTEDSYVINFSWADTDISFADILAAAGSVPLPPYIKRAEGVDDESNYQTMFAKSAGSVAAPTASLHFTERTLAALQGKGITTAEVTLHVGAGTFKPVKADTMGGHEMHGEYINVTADALLNIKRNIGQICAAGTTSLRTLETLYWLGVKTIQQPTIKAPALTQWEVYEEPLSTTVINAEEAIQGLLDWMARTKKEKLFTRTEIIIVPGYRFRLANMLITNFHQPRSTLLLLIAAAIGEDWKRVYAYAMENEFRFLSYGDASLLFI